MRGQGGRLRRAAARRGDRDPQPRGHAAAAGLDVGRLRRRAGLPGPGRQPDRLPRAARPATTATSWRPCPTAPGAVMIADYRDAGSPRADSSHGQGDRRRARAWSGCRARCGCSRPATGSTWSPGTCRWRRPRRWRPRSGTPTGPTPPSGSPAWSRVDLRRVSRRSPGVDGTGVRMLPGHRAAPQPAARPVVARRGAGADPGDARSRPPYADGWTLRRAGRRDAGLPALAGRAGSRSSAAR